MKFAMQRGGEAVPRRLSQFTRNTLRLYRDLLRLGREKGNNNVLAANARAPLI